jgi:hypothetical protein
MSKMGSDAEEVKDLSAVIVSYRLVRNLAITFNWVVLKKDEDKRMVPESFMAELEAIYGAETFSKVVEALKMTSAEVVSILPDKLDDKVTDAILKWCDQKEGLVVVDLEKVIEDCSQELEARKEEPRPPKRKSPKAASKKSSSVAKSPRTAKSTKKSAMEGNPEEKFRDLMDEVREKVMKIKLGQNDFKIYSETQEQIDALLFEATEEIMKIKKTLRVRFEKAQKSKSPAKTRRVR